MSVLMLMRQRMKAIETIKKITHAMRLISMSSHTRLRNKKTALTRYTQELSRLFTQVYSHAPNWHDPVLLPRNSQEDKRNLIILIGSQKGLCGTYNQNLFTFFEQNLPDKHNEQFDLISVGKRTSEHLSHNDSYTIVKRFNDFSQSLLTPIAQQITDFVLQSKPHYTTVTVYSNWSKSFFVQVPEKKVIVPLTLPSDQSGQTEEHEGYQWEQSPERLLTALAQSLLLATLEDILLTSLTAEQAARFVAMDNSTRSASNLLDEMTLDYNKRRQAKITRELTDLIGSL